ncbi:hypothetical protein COO91_09338 (plasmid) [Nostoc flagelliforme CCNUN1]|uniref:Uncharacterized protein n=1 Tax=Nostoc flagelliforme CCNUN1 TaxID=2038116 RepID=A0A2K8T640_9NOSO|nr:hypothetical protein COO91_09338 [Nostoc flagelliforme CCNUN1]
MQRRTSFESKGLNPDFSQDFRKEGSKTATRISHKGLNE